MTRPTRWFQAAAAAVTTLVVTSCYYDPYYSGGGGYDSGYVGGSGLNATFVYTSDDRWLYDPAVYCYYDRYRRAYYDPYLYGYYPVGYCPRPIYGAYHPGGWSGHGYCPPPSGYRDRYLANYQNRGDQLKASNYAWAQKVRERNDATADAWRNQRTRAASNFQSSREAQQNRNQQLRDTQSQRQDNLRGQQQDWADKVRSQRTAPPQRTMPSQPQRQPQRQPRPAYNQPVDTGSPANVARRDAARQQQIPRQVQQPAPRQPQESGDGGGGGGKWKEKMQERKVRYALLPLMQAEADREYMQRELVNLRKEAEIMKHVVD